MSNIAGKDDNGFPIIFGVSHLDGKTPVQVAFDLATREMLTDSVTTITFNPSLDATQNPLNYVPFAKATSTADNKTIRPWVVNASTGAVLIQIV